MIRDIKRASFKHKNNKLAYYAKSYFRQIIPSSSFQKKLEKRLNHLSEQEKEYIFRRVDYYNKLDESVELPKSAVYLSDFKLKNYKKTYFFDTYQYTRYYPSDYKICPLFGDITFVPDYPSLTKSRPILENNINSILLKLNKPRHYIFVNDKTCFSDKKNRLVSRSKARQEHRIRFLEKYSDHPLCDIGQVNTDMNIQFLKNRLTIEEQLKYKFILCLEGNDVASNLKWVMSSNSIAVMTKPKYESWFMEGTLIPDYHYILIKDDYSDLEERLTYYINNTQEALQIIKNAHEYVAQFKNEKQEDLISLLVLKKYFEKTNQII